MESVNVQIKVENQILDVTKKIKIKHRQGSMLVNVKVNLF